MSAKKPRKKCLFCDNLVSRNIFKFCSNKCQQANKNAKFISDWLAGLVVGYEKSTGALSRTIRKYLIDTRGEKCEECGWKKKHRITKKVPLNIDHTDGNYQNCRPENLKILCPNCHSLTPTYGALNKGKGRTMRYAVEALR